MAVLVRSQSGDRFQTIMKFDFPVYCGGLVALFIILLMAISTINMYESRDLQSAVLVLGQKAGFNVSVPWQPVPMPEYQAAPSQTMLPRNAVLKEKELETLQYFARHAKTYFEWGSGGSTELVSLFSAKKAYSIENHRPWYDEMMKREDINFWIANNVLTYRFVDLGETGDWGYPLDKGKSGEAYVNAIAETPETKFDMIVVDGRYRVACALRSLQYFASNDYYLFLHDGKRQAYQILLKYFEKVGLVESLLVLRPKLLDEKAKIELGMDVDKYLFIPS